MTNPGDAGPHSGDDPTAGSGSAFPDKPILEWTDEDWARWVAGRAPDVDADAATAPVVAEPEATVEGEVGHEGRAGQAHRPPGGDAGAGTAETRRATGTVVGGAEPAEAGGHAGDGPHAGRAGPPSSAGAGAGAGVKPGFEDEGAEPAMRHEAGGVETAEVAAGEVGEPAVRREAGTTAGPEPAADVGAEGTERVEPPPAVADEQGEQRLPWPAGAAEDPEPGPEDRERLDSPETAAEDGGEPAVRRSAGTATGTTGTTGVTGVTGVTGTTGGAGATGGAEPGAEGPAAPEAAAPEVAAEEGGEPAVRRATGTVPAGADEDERPWWEAVRRPPPDLAAEPDVGRDGVTTRALAGLAAPMPPPASPLPPVPPVPKAAPVRAPGRAPSRGAPATGVRPAPPRAAPVVIERTHRVRSALGLLGVAVLIGAMVAGLVTVAVFAISVALRRAVG